MSIFKLAYWLGILAEIFIRAPFNRLRKGVPKVQQRVTFTERTLLGLLTLGGFILPLIYSVTNWLSFADYHLPAWMGWLGVGLLVCAILVFARAHMDLKSYWSPSLEIYSGHSLITNGIYGRIRHPMYASQWLLAISQCLLLQNWVAGPVGLLVFIPFYVLRVRAEEKMMLDAFGEEYRLYMQRTGAVIPRF